MYLTTLMLGCWALGQAPQPTPGDPFSPVPTPAAASQPSAAAVTPPLQPISPNTSPSSERLTPVPEPGLESLDAEPAANTPPLPRTERPSRRPTPPEIVAEAMVLPAESRLTGQPFSLLAALSSTSERRRQLEVTHAYWRLVEAVAVCRFALQHENALKRLSPTADETALLRSARATSAALLREAEVAVIAAQHELAALALLPPESPLPLPSDPPHVGAYLTQFDSLFAVRAPSPRARLLDRTLPIRCQAIEGRAASVDAAEEALQAAQAGKPGSTRADAVVIALEELSRQRQAWIASVCHYNHDIADYAFSVAAPGINAAAIARMLVQPSQEPLRPIPLEPSSGVQQAGAIQPIPTLAPRSPANRPSPAQGRLDPPPPDPPTPTPAPGWTPTDTKDPPPASRDEPANLLDQQRPRLVPLREEPATFQTPAASPKPEPTFRSANKPLAWTSASDLSATLVPAPTAGADTPLADDPSQPLVRVLCSEDKLPERTGETMSLADSLQEVAVVDRLGLVTSYWVARLQGAQYVVLAQQAELLDALAALAAEDQDQLGQRQLRVARLTTEAALDEAHAALLEARFDLALRMRRPPDAPWPAPSTTPRVNSYPLHMPAWTQQSESWFLRRLETMLPGLADELGHHAWAATEAEATRAAAFADFRSKAVALEKMLDSVSRRTEQAFRFLRAVTEYNRTVAEYVLMTTPPNTPAEKLADALVVNQ